MAPLRILVVCTANVCRSPMAAALLAHQLRTLEVDAVVTSAGTRATQLRVDPQAVAAMGELGIDLSDHVPRRATDDRLAVDGADLVLTMTREHLREVVVVDRAVWPRSFTLREFVRRSDLRAGSLGGQPALGEWLGHLVEGRRPADLLGDSADDDISDPYGEGSAAVRRTARELEALTGIVADRLAGPRRIPAPPHR